MGVRCNRTPPSPSDLVELAGLVLLGLGDLTVMSRMERALVESVRMDVEGTTTRAPVRLWRITKKTLICATCVHVSHKGTKQTLICCGTCVHESHQGTKQTLICRTATPTQNLCPVRLAMR